MKFLWSLIAAAACSRAAAFRTQGALISANGLLYRPAVFAGDRSMRTMMMAENDKPTGHSPPAGHGVPQQEVSPEAQALQQRIGEHQKGAARLSKPEEVRTLAEYSTGFGVMSTISKDFGFPAGSVVGFALDAGLPFFVFSGMSQHTQDLLVDPRCSLTVTSKDFKGAPDGRVSLMGTVEKAPAGEVDRLKEAYLAKHPGAFWVNFGDFNWFRMKEIVDIRPWRLSGHGGRMHARGVPGSPA
ncbi:unnamed protein product [Heterosigma akashiwo]